MPGLNPFEYFREKIADGKFALRTQLQGRNVEVKQLLSGEIIEPDNHTSHVWFEGLTGTEKEVWILVYNNVYPLRILGSSIINKTTASASHIHNIYPFFDDGEIPEKTPSESRDRPWGFLWIPTGDIMYENLDEKPQTFKEAKEMVSWYPDGGFVRIDNYAEEDLELDLWAVYIYG